MKHKTHKIDSFFEIKLSIYVLQQYKLKKVERKNEWGYCYHPYIINQSSYVCIEKRTFKSHTKMIAFLAKHHSYVVFDYKKRLVESYPNTQKALKHAHLFNPANFFVIIDTLCKRERVFSSLMTIE